LRGLTHDHADVSKSARGNEGEVEVGKRHSLPKGVQPGVLPYRFRDPSGGGDQKVVAQVACGVVEISCSKCLPE